MRLHFNILIYQKYKIKNEIICNQIYIIFHEYKINSSCFLLYLKNYNKII